MHDLIETILQVPAWGVCVLVGLLVFAEDALFVGFVIPGETAAVLGGVAASRGDLPVALILAVVVFAAIAGDSVGYEVGRRLGPRILDARILAKRRRRIDDARALLARRAGTAVFLGRFLAFFRATMPALAGAARVPYPRFLAFNAVGGLVWGVGSVMVGYLAGESYARVERLAGRGSALAVAVVVVVGVVVWRVRRHRADRGDGPAFALRGPAGQLLDLPADGFAADPAEGPVGRSVPPDPDGDRGHTV